MARRSSSSSSSCAICEGGNLAAVCAPCVNLRLAEYSANLKSLKTKREALYSRLEEALLVKKKADEQLNWRVLQKEKVRTLRNRLYNLEKKLIQDKANVKRVSNDLKDDYGLLEAAFAKLGKKRIEVLEKEYPNIIHALNLRYAAMNSELCHKQSVVIKQICRLFPMHKVNFDGEGKDSFCGSYDQICNARLPRGLDPHSVPSEELAASLGYMLQLLNLVIPNLAAPALHNAGFAGSCSRIWQRYSYWDAKPSLQSMEYPLFIPRQIFCTSGEENSWSERSQSNFGVASVDSERKACLDPTGSYSFKYSSASSHSSETHKDLQKGISLLKMSVASITSYCYQSLGLDVPSGLSTFGAFAKVLDTLCSPSSKSAYWKNASCSDAVVSRCSKGVPRVNKSVLHVDSSFSSHNAVNATAGHSSLLNSVASFVYGGEVTTQPGRSESPVEGWDIVEHPRLPPPPSQVEDVEHWTRAMFTDATKK